LVNNVLIQQVAERDGVALDTGRSEQPEHADQGQILATGQYADWEAFLAANGLSEETFQLIVEESVVAGDDDGYLCSGGGCRAGARPAHLGE
jgi:hypothetical protein